ncbi:C40 family peptidase [Hymenobacter volaticus]|uniref:C40 family peptidase n=1 Tax=Hymenobacter volaticus TaxID=2932254 RepID=A0ABY4GCG3_9BACT|nr:C40 family peptidase [Hymenobacter volaticus]UOQ68239.1 C40 family peptidase [Hymenobacter volaticus]
MPLLTTVLLPYQNLAPTSTVRGAVSDCTSYRFPVAAAQLRHGWNSAGLEVSSTFNAFNRTLPMRYIWITFVALVVLMLGVFELHKPQSAGNSQNEPNREQPPVQSAVWTSNRAATPHPDSVVRFAMRQLGTNYCYAGNTPATGFDCSGFVQYVFGRFKVEMPHSTGLLISVGKPIARTQARPGDIVVFTGTAASSTTPGHAGIVVSEPGEPLRFIHSSSARRESGVKISQVEGTDYERRFMNIRRVL